MRKTQQFQVTVTTTPEYANTEPYSPDEPFGYIKPEKREEVRDAFRKIYLMVLAKVDAHNTEEQS